MTPTNERFGASGDSDVSSLRRTAAIYRVLRDTLDQGFGIIDVIVGRDGRADHRFVEVNAAFERQTGLSNVVGRAIRELVPDLEERWLQTLEEVARTGAAARIDNVARTGGRHYSVNVFKIGPVGDGKIGVLFTDISDGTRTKTALRDSERRLRTLIEGIPQLLWRSERAGRWTWASRQWCDYTGLSNEQSVGQGWLEAVHPEDRRKAMEAWRRTTSEQRFEAGYRIRRASDGAYRWFETRAMPSHDDDAGVVEWLGTSTDVHDLHQLREHEKALALELQHRVRNALAVVRSIVRRTAETSVTVEDYAAHLEGRIDAFSRIQTSLARHPDTGIELGMMVADELAACAVRENGQLRIDGPPVRLASKGAASIGLAIHELTTNAIKHGALAGSKGHVTVRWRVEAEGAVLRLEWKETGVEAPPVLRRRGFGMTLLEKSLVYELKAAVQVKLEPDGLRCVMILPKDGWILLPQTPE
ncbi:MAG: sensor histidine kinase [Pararhizobium sp.]